MIAPDLVIALMIVGISIAIAGMVVYTTPKRAKEESKKTFEKVADVAKTTVAAPPKVPIPDAQNIISQPYTNLEELPIGDVITGELTKIKGNKRIVIKRLGIRIRPGLLNNDIFVFHFGKLSYHIKPNKILEFKATPKRFGRNKGPSLMKLVYDITLSEPLEPDGSIIWDQEVEDIITDSGMDQLIKAAETESTFEFTRTMVIAIILAGLFLFPFGLALNASAHIIPTTIIHWGNALPPSGAGHP